jgi:ABC-type nitrate/sulfonate/bicarbonate transport system permease component
MGQRQAGPSGHHGGGQRHVLVLPALQKNIVPQAIRAQVVGYFDPANWWQTVLFHLGHLVHGQLLPPNPTTAQGNAWCNLPGEVLSSFAVSLRLMSVALVAGVALGLLLGWLISQLAPAWARRPAWGLTSLPDVLVATFLDLAPVIFGHQRFNTKGLLFWHQFWP